MAVAVTDNTTSLQYYTLLSNRRVCGKSNRYRRYVKSWQSKEREETRADVYAYSSGMAQ